MLFFWCEKDSFVSINLIPETFDFLPNSIFIPFPRPKLTLHCAVYTFSIYGKIYFIVYEMVVSKYVALYIYNKSFT